MEWPETEIRVKISKKLLDAYGKEELESILTEEVNRRYIEYLDKEFEKQCRGEPKETPKGFLSSEFINVSKKMKRNG